ncbi:30S ribosomal protein S15 [Candidatus Woesearchaeota archaeon]|nr:30S ribosomal protein S15 [Candidatus Woesearchaeota archaeon]
MAKMHSRKRGTSMSKRPIKRSKPTWLRYKPREIEILITKAAKEGKRAASIGIMMRDEYGVPDVKAATGKRITAILQERGLGPKMPDDLTSLMRRVLKLQKHLDANKLDMPAFRGIQLTEAKIKRLVKYYKSTGTLPPDWKYDRDKIKMLGE